MPATCTICDLPNARACTRCHSTQYCSPECQQTDWPAHKLLCSQYSTHTGRPHPSYKRAILFPPKEVNPRFIWMECKIEQDEGDPGTTFELSQVMEYLGGKLGPYGAFPEYKLIGRNLLRDRVLANTLEVTCRETFAVDGSQVKKSIVKATNDCTGITWKGPIVALKKRGLGMDPHFYMDIDLQDYRDVVDYFISYGNESVQDIQVGRKDTKGKVRGVKINCVGDQRAFGAEVYSPVDVPIDHPVFYEPIAPISSSVGMPLHTRKYPPNRLWKEDHSAYMNIPATFLHQNIDDTSSAEWGWVPTMWQDEVGSVLVVRSDGQDVTTQQLEALCYFCRFKMPPLFENA